MVCPLLSHRVQLRHGHCILGRRRGWRRGCVKWSAAAAATAGEHSAEAAVNDLQHNGRALDFRLLGLRNQQSTKLCFVFRDDTIL
jgi:hypothetical protein